tara:strand:- start:5753 stop:12739 length:6987 start_codon:yes stop_codon:yes gene_type:complete
MPTPTINSSQGNTNLFDIPTNPLFTADSSYSTSNTRLYTAIHTDDSEIGTSSHTYVDLTSNSPASTVNISRGYKIHCYDSTSGAGLIVNPSDIASFDYFVLINADNHLNHHFAKIILITKEDVIGDSFEFSPPLGNEIPKDTKFMIFKGPPVDSNVVAFSAGIKMELQNSLIVARPLFYFYDEVLDKKGELNHNSKYLLNQRGLHTTPIAMNHNTTITLVARTSKDYLGRIIDYSKYTLKVDMIDNLSIYDRGELGSMEGDAISGYPDYGDYEQSFVNARRSITNLTGKSNANIRYLNYTHSPNVVNMTPNVVETLCAESIGGSSGFSESKLSDANRIFTKKIKENDDYIIKHRVHVGNLTEWKKLDMIITASVVTSGVRVITVNVDDIESFLVVGNHIKINNLICIIKAISNQSSNSTITLENYYREETEGIFTAGTPTISVSHLLYRTAFNSYNNTLLTDFKIVEGREKNLTIRFYGSSLALIEAKATASSKVNGLLTLSFSGDSYDSNLLSYAIGDYSIEVERYTGKIEHIESYKESGQSMVRVNGRDSFRNLLSPVVNKNTLFSNDIIYSSNGPFVDLEPMRNSSNNANITISSLSFGATTFTTSASLSCVAQSNASSPTSNQIYSGMKLYIRYLSSGKPVFKLIGEVGTLTTGTAYTTIQLYNYSLVMAADAANLLYREKNKTYSYNKALSSNSTDGSSTSLLGAADKGIVFTGGVSISATGQEGSVLTNSLSIHSLGKGYYLQNTGNVKSDNTFRSTLADDSVGTNVLKFNTVNSLLDFTVLKVVDKDATKEILIAPYMPLTLGRVQNNYANTEDIVLSTTDDNGVTIPVVSGLHAIGVQQISLGQNPSTAGILTNDADPLLHVGDAVYYNNTLLGLSLGTRYTNIGNTHWLFLDRLTTIAVPNGAQLKVLKRIISDNFQEYPKYSHELKLTNAAHLHTGKTIGLLNSSVSVTGYTNYFNYYMKLTASTFDMSSSKKFGDPIYRITSVEKGKNQLSNSSISFKNENIDVFYDSKQNAKYYTSAYKLNAGLNLSEPSNSQVFGLNRTHRLSPHLPIEQRGITSVEGSRYFNAKIKAKGSSTAMTTYDNLPILGRHITDRTSRGNPYALVESTKLRASNADRLFLFITGDNMPYSRLRYDSLFNNQKPRTISSYGILGINASQVLTTSHTKDDAKILTHRLALQDSDYSAADIYSSTTEIGSNGTNPKMIGLMRLTEVVVDSFFNQIDPEELIKESKITPASRFPHTTSTKLLNGSTELKIGTNNVTISGRKILTPNTSFANLTYTQSYISDAFGQILGKVTSKSTTYIELDYISKTNGNAYATTALYQINAHESRYDGNIEYASTATASLGSGWGEGGYMTGHGSSSGILKNTDNIHLGKTIFSTILGYDCSIPISTISFFPDGWNVLYEPIRYGRLIVKVSDANSTTSDDSSHHYFVFWASRNGEDNAPVLTGQITGINVESGGEDFENLSPTYIEVAYNPLFYLGKNDQELREYFSEAMIQNSAFTNLVDITTNYSNILLSPKGGSLIATKLVDGSTGSNYQMTLDMGITTSTLSGKAGFGGAAGSVYVNNASGFNGNYSALLGGQASNDSSALTNISRETHTMLPYFFNHIMGAASPASYNSPSTLINILSGCATTSSNTTVGNFTFKNELFMNGFLPVVLNISESEETETLADVGTVGPEVKGVFKRLYSFNGSNHRKVLGFNIKLASGFAQTLADGTVNPSILDAAGVSIGFKPRLKKQTQHWANLGDSVQVGGRACRNYSVSISDNSTGVNEYGWLKLIDLTGCYLVSSASTSPDELSEWTTNAVGHSRSMNNATPTVIAYVISHTVDTNSSPTNQKHIIVVDRGLPNDTYRILQPNPVAIHPSFPPKFKLNTLSSGLSLNPATNKPYSKIASYHNKNSLGGVAQGDNEGVLSMMVALDIDFTDSSNQRVMTTTDSHANVLSWLNNTLIAVSDGETTFTTTGIWDVSTIAYKSTGLDLGEFNFREPLAGVISLSEIMTLSVSKEFSSDSQRCLIGTTLNICYETEKLLDNLLKEENIDYTMTSSNYPVFVAPNFQGKSLLDSVNYLLNKKNKTIDYYDNKFRILPKDDALIRPNILISDKSDIKIYEYEKSSSLYDRYNEVIVYGRTHRAIRKDLKNINKLGRKTLEIFDNKLISQAETDEAAISKLLLHSSGEEKISITISHKNVSQMKVGDIINFELQSENIPRREYLVLQAEHNLNGLIKLQLGKYHKLLEDRFAELLVESKESKTEARSNKFPELNPSFSFIEELKLKEVKFLARKRVASGEGLGFATVLNTNTPPLGFEGTVTFTTLAEIDL